MADVRGLRFDGFRLDGDAWGADCAVADVRGLRFDGFRLDGDAWGADCAVADVRGLRFDGFLAWLAWLFVHLL